jgi:hypothetical protein
MNEHISLLERSRISWLYPIYVPSYSRAGTAPLLEMLKAADPRVQGRVYIVVRPSEVAAYRSAYPWATVLAEKVPGIGPARMACLRYADTHGQKRIVVLDDDIIHVSLLERIPVKVDRWHTRRHSARVSGIAEPDLLLKSLAVGCRMADAVFQRISWASYGAARNALFSGDVEPRVGATLNKGSFPACVMFIDVQRFKMRVMPKSYQFHGEDLAMFLYSLDHGHPPFTLPGVAYDQHGGIASTIPLDPQDEVGRPHLATTITHFPNVHPYLRISMRNKRGGVMRIGVNWMKWYRATDSKPVEIPLAELIKEI